MKIKIRISGRTISATPINSSITVPPREKIGHRGEKGLPPGAGRRIRSAVEELGPDALFSTVLLSECPTPQIINRIRTHLESPAVGVIEFGVKNGWHLHIVHLRDQDDATKILSNYGENHHEPVRDNGRSAWYLTKGIGILPKSEYPKSWYFCSRSLGRDETFYIDSTLQKVMEVGTWQILEFCIVADRTYTTIAHLKNLPVWDDSRDRVLIL